MSEDELCAIFAEAVRSNSAFKEWLLAQTKFREWASIARLLDGEQARRPAKAWWRHWHCLVKDTDRGSETDILLAFECKETRFALHIENKLKEDLKDYQALAYAPRTEQMKNNKWVPYGDFETIIVAPEAYLIKFQEKCCLFDRQLGYEVLGAYLKEFKLAPP